MRELVSGLAAAAMAGFWSAPAFAEDWRFCIVQLQTGSEKPRLGLTPAIRNTDSDIGQTWAKSVADQYSGTGSTVQHTECSVSFADEAAVERGRAAFTRVITNGSLRVVPVEFNPTAEPAERQSDQAASDRPFTPPIELATPQPVTPAAQNRGTVTVYRWCMLYEPFQKKHYFSRVFPADINQQGQSASKFKQHLVMIYGVRDTPTIGARCGNGNTPEHGERTLAEEQARLYDKRETVKLTQWVEGH